MKLTTLQLLASFFCLMFVSLACGNMEETEIATPAAPTAVEVNIRDFHYRPAELTIKVGTEVTFINHDKSDHTVTSDNGTFDKALQKGDKFKFTFDKAGTFSYHDRLFDKSGLKGKIIVE